MSPADLPVVSFASPEALTAWLGEHHATAPGVWMKLAKKGADCESVTYGEAIDVALCFGWIDGQKQAFDDTAWLQRFTPRRATSRWSQINCGRAEALIEAGLMQPAGAREVELAKADGRWDAAYAGSRAITVPDDLQAALDADDVARAFFGTLDRQNRYAILYRVGDAKRPATRARRIEQYVAMLHDHRTIHGTTD